MYFRAIYQVLIIYSYISVCMYIYTPHKMHGFLNTEFVPRAFLVLEGLVHDCQRSLRPQVGMEPAPARAGSAKPS